MGFPVMHLIFILEHGQKPGHDIARIVRETVAGNAGISSPRWK